MASLIKVIIQGLMYACVIVFIISQFRSADSDANPRVSRRTILLAWIACTIGLLIFSTTHYGNNGTGETHRLPVSDEVAVVNNEGNISLEHAEGDDVRVDELEKFSFDQERFYWQSGDTLFNIYHFSSKTMEVVIGKEQYDAIAIKRIYPKRSAFREFYDHYGRYWGGWRFWLLP